MKYSTLILSICLSALLAACINEQDSELTEKSQDLSTREVTLRINPGVSFFDVPLNGRVMDLDSGYLGIEVFDEDEDLYASGLFEGVPSNP